MQRRLFALFATLAALLVVAPAATAAPTKAKAKASWGWYYGATTLDVDPGTLEALGRLGVSPGAVKPASLEGARYSFPITSSLGHVLRTGVVSHKGAISLSAATRPSSFRGGKLKIGPVGTTLTAGAADALNEAFGTTALSDDTVLGDATIRYRLFPF